MRRRLTNNTTSCADAIHYAAVGNVAFPMMPDLSGTHDHYANTFTPSYHPTPAPPPSIYSRFKSNQLFFRLCRICKHTAMTVFGKHTIAAHADALTAVRGDPSTLNRIPFHLRTPAVVRAAILTAASQGRENPGDLIKWAPHLWGHEHTVLLAAQYSSGEYFKNVSVDLREDKRVIHEALKCGARRALVHASACLKGDKDTVILALVHSSCEDTLKYIATRLWSDKDVVLAAVRRHPGHIEMASSALRKDPTVLRACHPGLYAEEFELGA